MRSGECTESGIASINGEGSGSKSNGTDADHLTVFYDGVERAPMGVVWNKLVIHWALVDAATKLSTTDR
jgi:hypothetical protein